MHLAPKFSCFRGFLLKKSRTLFIHSPVHSFPNCQMPDDPAGMTAFPRRSGTRSMSWKIPCWHTAPLRRRDQMDLDASLCLHLQFCLFLLLIGIPGRQHCRSQPFCYCFIGTNVSEEYPWSRPNRAAAYRSSSELSGFRARTASPRASVTVPGYASRSIWALIRIS